MTLPLGANLGVFAALCCVIWVTGTRLTKACDELSRRLAISREAMGFVFLALVTQLPEVVTNSTGAIRGDGELVVNSMFGGVLMQTAVLAGADLALPRHALTFAARASITLLQAALLAGLLAVALGISVVGDTAIYSTDSGYAVGWAPLLLAVLYVAALRTLFLYEDNQAWQTVRDEQSESQDQSALSSQLRPLENHSTKRLVAESAGAAGAIFVCGVGVVRVSEAVAVQSGLGSSFIGATLLASATSLPEFSTTVAAVRLRAYSMAISDIMGSNAVMLVLLLPSDLLYSEGLLFDSIDASGKFSLAIGILVTCVYLIGLVRRSSRRYFGLGSDSWVVLLCYGAALVGLYQLR